MEANSKQAAAQARYKKNFDDRLRRKTKHIRVGDFVLLCVDHRNEKDVRHELAAVTEGPFKVVDGRDSTVVIERSDHSVERFSRGRVVLAPRRRSSVELQSILDFDKDVITESPSIATDEDNLQELATTPHTDRRRVTFAPLLTNEPNTDAT